MVWRCCEVFCRVSKKITDSNTTYLLTHYQWSNCFDTNLCLFNPIFNPTIICMLVIKTQICTRVHELCDCIVQRTTAMVTKQRQRQHHMSVSSPSCAGARASFRTTTTTAMVTTNVDDKASGASAWHFHIASRRGDDDSNYGDDDDECQRQGLGRERPAFSYRVAQRRRQQQQLLATTND